MAAKMAVIIKNSKDLLDFKDNVVETTLSVGDILFAWVYPCECKIHKKSGECPELKYKSRFFNPCLDNLAARERELFKDKIIVPVCAIERKECSDFISSIIGNSSIPGFNRMQDQKMRLLSFVQTTGKKHYATAPRIYL